MLDNCAARQLSLVADLTRTHCVCMALILKKTSAFHSQVRRINLKSKTGIDNVTILSKTERRMNVADFMDIVLSPATVGMNRHHYSETNQERNRGRSTETDQW